MGSDNYIVGNAAAVGPHSSATNTTFNQNSGTMLPGADMASLADQLGRLKQNLIEQASTTEHYSAVATVSAAEDAARKGDESGVLEKLKAVGTWALDAATKIGVSVATEAIKKASGLS
ncbi:UNVERIFIED_ORG: hypothetical protein LHK14_07695 [Roseateles sp. XES5]|nr:hypothetical protein [Roseateles sp. XES5]